MTKGSGEIKDVFIKEGSEVKEGNVLFTTNSIEAEFLFYMKYILELIGIKFS